MVGRQRNSPRFSYQRSSRRGTPGGQSIRAINRQNMQSHTRRPWVTRRIRPRRRTPWTNRKEYGGLPVLRFVNCVAAHHISRLAYRATGFVCPVYCCRVTGFDLSVFPPPIDIFDSSDKSLGPARTVLCGPVRRQPLPRRGIAAVSARRVHPETLLTIGEHLSQRGWTSTDIHAVLGGNFPRVAPVAMRLGVGGWGRCQPLLQPHLVPTAQQTTTDTATIDLLA